eukprot:3931676-Rhodomonas_salina.1
MEVYVGMYASGMAGVGGRCPRLSGGSAGDAPRLCGRTDGLSPDSAGEQAWSVPSTICHLETAKRGGPCTSTLGMVARQGLDPWRCTS